MKKSDLKTGDIIETRDGTKAIVLLNIRNYDTKHSNILFCLEDDVGSYLFLEDYDENLEQIDRNYSEYDIVKICSSKDSGETFEKFFKFKKLKIDWNWKRYL